MAALPMWLMPPGGIYWVCQVRCTVVPLRQDGDPGVMSLWVWLNVFYGKKLIHKKNDPRYLPLRLGSVHRTTSGLVSWASFLFVVVIVLLVTRDFFFPFKRFVGLVIYYCPVFFKYFLFKRKRGWTQRNVKIKASRVLHDIFISSLHIPIGIWELYHGKNSSQILNHYFVLIKQTFPSGQEVFMVENSIPLTKIQIYRQSVC